MKLETISAEKLVNSAQTLIPFYPLPSQETIDDILSQLCKTFSIPFTTESNAKQLWRNRVAPSYQKATPNARNTSHVVNHTSQIISKE